MILILSSEQEYIQTFAEAGVKYRTFHYAKELIANLKSNDCAIFSDIKSVSDNIIERIKLVSIIYDKHSYLIINNATDYSSAKYDEKEAEIKYATAEMYNAKKAMLHIVASDVAALDLNVIVPDSFVNLYWQFQYGKIKPASIYQILNISHATFYNYIKSYENSVDYYAELRKQSEIIISIPKKGILDYDFILDILNRSSYFSSGTISDIAIHYQIPEIDAWRLLRSFFYSSYLKKRNKLSSGEKLLDKPVYKQIQFALNYMDDGNADVFILLENTGFASFDSKESILLAYDEARQFKNSDGSYK